MTLEAVVFDFDGLIIDSEWMIYEAALNAFATHGHKLPLEAWATIIGTNSRTDPDWWVNLCRAAGVTDFAEADFDATYRELRREDFDDMPALPGVVDLVADLRAAGVPLGIASSSSRGWIDRHVTRLGLDSSFDTLVGSDTVGGVGKPNPDVYLRACSDLGADPTRSVALEDSAHGVAAAKAAGMRAVGIPSRITVHNDFSQADLVVDSLEDLSAARLRSLIA